MHTISKFIEHILVSLNVEYTAAYIIRHALLVVIVFVFAFLAGFLCRKVLVPLVIKLTSKTNIEWDSILFDKAVLYTACNIVPAVVIWKLLPKVFFQYPFCRRYFTTAYGCLYCHKLHPFSVTSYSPSALPASTRR